MIFKLHNYDEKTILAVCDKEHLGKEFEDKKLCFRVSEKFYGNKGINEKELIDLIKKVDSANLFGNKCVEILEKQDLISESNVILIKGIKHAQIYKV